MSASLFFFFFLNSEQASWTTLGNNKELLTAKLWNKPYTNHVWHKWAKSSVGVCAKCARPYVRACADACVSACMRACSIGTPERLNRFWFVFLSLKGKLIESVLGYVLWTLFQDGASYKKFTNASIGISNEKAVQINPRRPPPKLHYAGELLKFWNINCSYYTYKLTY